MLQVRRTYGVPLGNELFSCSCQITAPAFQSEPYLLVGPLWGIRLYNCLALWDYTLFLPLLLSVPIVTRPHWRCCTEQRHNVEVNCRRRRNPPVSLFLSPSLSPSVSLSVSLSLSLSVSLFVYLSLSLFFSHLFLPISLSVSVCLSLCPSLSRSLFPSLSFPLSLSLILLSLTLCLRLSLSPSPPFSLSLPPSNTSKNPNCHWSKDGRVALTLISALTDCCKNLFHLITKEHSYFFPV